MNASPSLPRLYLIRHGETEWSLTGRHTSRTELTLTPRGEDEARQLGARLQGISFSRVFTSPRVRARRTCELAGVVAPTEIDADLREWEYGDYEGRTGADIRAERPDWNLFIDGAPGGEMPAEVFARAQAFIRRLDAHEGNIAVFSHGHFLRVLAAAWVGFPVVHAQHLALATASVGILGYDHARRDSPVISLWNETRPTLSQR